MYCMSSMGDHSPEQIRKLCMFDGIGCMMWESLMGMRGGGVGNMTSPILHNHYGLVRRRGVGRLTGLKGSGLWDVTGSV